MFSLTAKKVSSLVDISREIGQVFFAVVLIGPLISGSINLDLIVIGTIGSVINFLLSYVMSDYT